MGLRLFNLFLEFNNRPRESFTAYTKKLSNNEKIKINHPESFDINSMGKNTILLIGDSFGVGYKCGNSKNIAGCLKRISGKHVVNLSRQGTTPAKYLKSLKTYIQDQRKNNLNINGEIVHVLLYSNDVLIDDEACNYFNSNKKLNLEKSEINRLNLTCTSKRNDSHLNQVFINRFYSIIYFS